MQQQQQLFEQQQQLLNRQQQQQQQQQQQLQQQQQPLPYRGFERNNNDWITEANNNHLKGSTENVYYFRICTQGCILFVFHFTICICSTNEIP